MPMTKLALVYFLHTIAIASTGLVITMYFAPEFLAVVASDTCFIILAFWIARSLLLIFVTRRPRLSC